jgi:uncharacterized lipoprotein YehR (DUF1307 family)
MNRIILLLAISLFAVACGHKKDAKSFEAALEASTGQPHSIAKLYTQVGDYVVYRNDSTGEYVAYNMKQWDRETMTSMDQYLSAGAVEGTDIVHGLEVRSEWVTSTSYSASCDCDVDSSGYVDFYYGGGFRFENNSTASRDLDTLAALREEAAEQFIAFKLQSEFSLSSDRAAELAKLANRYDRMESVRELTQREKDRFAMSALGVDMGKVEKALKSRAQGDEGAYLEMLEIAARANQTTPENIGRFFETIVNENI